MVPAIRDWTPQALDALFGVVQDATANAKARRKAALKIAEFLLPKAGKKAKVIPDEYGFSISPNLASAYRDIQLELRALQSTRKIPAIAAKIKKLEARSDAIMRRLQVPYPTKYGNKEAGKDYVRLIEFTSLRDHGTALTEAQQAEEAHLRARFDVFDAGPEAILRRRRAALEDAERRFQGGHAPPLSCKDQSDLKVLRRLYPAEPPPNLPELDDQWLEIHGHPFADEVPAADGIFYPLHSLLRQAGLGDERKWLEQLAAIGRKDLTHALKAEALKADALNADALKEDALKEDAQDQQNPELVSKARMRDMQERRAAGPQLTASEAQELRDLRERYPEFAAVMDLMDFPYLCDWRREVARARRAGLSAFATCEQADIVCLRLRDQTKFTTESDAQEYVRGGKAAEAASLKR